MFMPWLFLVNLTWVKQGRVRHQVVILVNTMVICWQNLELNYTVNLATVVRQACVSSAVACNTCIDRITPKCNPESCATAVWKNDKPKLCYADELIGPLVVLVLWWSPPRPPSLVAASISVRFTTWSDTLAWVWFSLTSSSSSYIFIRQSVYTRKKSVLQPASSLLKLSWFF